MLILSRKHGERIVIGPDIELTVVAIRGERVHLAHFVEVPGSEGTFQFTDLTADRGLSEQSPVAGPGDAPFAGDGPGIQQVMVVEPGHVERIPRLFRCLKRTNRFLASAIVPV